MTDESIATDLFQVMPPLPDDQYALLKADIAARGVLIPVEYDEEGHILDGHHRVKACRELRMEWPSTIRYLPDMKARRQHARSLNLLRRQLTDEQRAQIMRDMRQDGMTIREIAKAAGVSVGTVHNAVAFKNEQDNQPDDFEGDEGGENATPEIEKPHLHPVQSAILANPTQSDRAIAKEIGVENSTVSRNRQKLIATGQLAPVSESKGIDGKTYRGQLAKTVAKSSQVKKAGEALQKVADAAENLEALELQVRSGETTVKKLEQACKTQERMAAVQRQMTSDTTIMPRLYHQDAVAFLTSLEPKSADLLLTDPPYMTDVADIQAFAASWVDLALSRVKPTGRAYIFTGSYPKELQTYLTILLQQTDWAFDDVLVWSYQNTIGPAPTHTYKRNWQACFYLYGPEAPPLQCPLLVEQFAARTVNAPDARNGFRLHSWQKPDDLAEQIIAHSTQTGQTVIDPFAGTGTFLAAAARMGRIGVGCDQDPAMLDRCQQRGLSLTGNGL